MITLELRDQTDYTPMMQQYLEIKKDYTDFIVFFRLGDFYEMFFTDALVASKELEIVLTGRDAGVEERVPMCGIPYHAAALYIDKLIDKGFKVAIVEQVEDPALAKGIVRREVIQLITPGTLTDGDLLDEKSNVFIGALSETKTQYLLAYSDLTTGETHIVMMPREMEWLKNEILNLDLKELIVSSTFNQKTLRPLMEMLPLTVSISDQTELTSFYRPLVQDIYDKDLLIAIARLINYLIKTQRKELMHLQKVHVFESMQYLHIDNNSIRNLEIIETIRTQSKRGSLFWMLDRCETAMGSRFLKQNLLRPLVDKEKIYARYQMVEDFNSQFLVKEDIRLLLRDVYDLERIVGRISFGNANGKDLVNLARSLRQVPPLKTQLNALGNLYAKKLIEKIPDFSALSNLIGRAIVDNPPITTKEGGLIRDGYSSELDQLKYAGAHGKEWLSAFEASERERTGIKKLKIGYNRVFGYYIEITNGQLESLKPEFGYERKQTLTNSERFVTAELKEKEALILGSQEKAVQLEYELFLAIREKAKQETEALQDLAKTIAEIDLLMAFSSVAMDHHYCRPELVESRSIHVIGGRHAVVEKTLDEGLFVENDLTMDEKTNILLITGPNMSGKSTYMRQLALMVIMAQMGSFVAATTAKFPIFDRIFTRIGAADDLSTGKSTFMVEMLEVNVALQNATKASLILFDEIGRGTATYDGMALAQAIIEYCHHKIDCKILFSTHYHELTYLEDDLASLHNVHVLAKEDKGNIVFLHRVADGPTDKSYGIHVGKLAKLPPTLLKRARAILDELEKNHGYNVIKPQVIDLFNYEIALEKEQVEENEYLPLLDQIRELDINDLTPLNALNILADIIEKSKKLP